MSNRLTPMIILLALWLGASFSLAADRHVYLDTDGDGQLNDCPNPAHNSKGTSNTDELLLCQGGAQDGKIIGSVAGRTSSQDCTGGGGSVLPASNGLSADVDGDGQAEALYGHPQACVWNMAPSDSCEVHAGTYSAPGAECDADCSEFGTKGLCDNKSTCWFASVLAFGMGPNMNDTGYGTAGSPGFLRAAEMNGVVDSWDPDGDKEPLDGQYPAILSGDVVNPNVFDTTTCDSVSCTGDAFYTVVVGCPDNWGEMCEVGHADGEHGPEIDTDADGVYDWAVNVRKKNVDHLIIKDLEFTRYNGGHTASGSPRVLTGNFNLHGTGSTDGLKVDHVYVHDNDYSLGSPSGTENHWAIFADSSNSGCVDHTEIKDSFIVQNNEKIFNDDCGPGVQCGCPQYVHDNRILVDVTSPRAAGRLVVIPYWKSIDRVGDRPKVPRFWNNEVIIKNTGSSTSRFIDLQLHGNGQGTGDGELWIYGNIFRRHPSMTANWKRFWSGFCTTQGDGTGSWRTYIFNNTFDLGKEMSEICGDGDPGELIVEANNAYVDMRTAHDETGVLQTRRAREFCSADISSASPSGCTVPSETGFAAWFQGPAGPDTHEGLLGYTVSGTSPLKSAGSCDPDQDGVPGVDYDGDGTIDTSWYDISGNLVDCTTLDSPINVGAIQSADAPTGSAPNRPGLSVSNVTIQGATLLGSAFADADEGDFHAASRFQVDLATGDFSSPVSDSGLLGGSVIQWQVSGLTPGTAFASRVRYQDSSGWWSEWSPPTDGTFTTLVDTVPPATVQNLRRTDQQ